MERRTTNHEMKHNKLSPHTCSRSQFLEYKLQIARYKLTGLEHLSSENLREYARLTVYVLLVQGYHAQNGDYDWRI